MYRSRKSGGSGWISLGFLIAVFVIYLMVSWSTMMFFGILHHEVPIVVGGHVARISAISYGSAMQLVAPGFLVAAIVQFVSSSIKG